jgi:hypothetical protein
MYVCVFKNKKFIWAKMKKRLGFFNGVVGNCHFYRPPPTTATNMTKWGDKQERERERSKAKKYIYILMF